MNGDVKQIETINALIANRRSIYPAMYTGERVPDEVISQMLENANWAPTHKLTEPWRFTVFCDSGLQRLGDFQADLYCKKAEVNGTFNPSTFEKLKSKPLTASHVISVGLKRNPVVPEEEEISSVAAAVQNMYLTASAHGVGMYWGSGGITYYPEATSFFGLEDTDRLLGFIYVGFPKRWPEGKRKPVEEKVNWVRA